MGISSGIVASKVSILPHDPSSLRVFLGFGSLIRDVLKTVETYLSTKIQQEDTKLQKIAYDHICNLEDQTLGTRS